jgi:hypothetical protein
MAQEEKAHGMAVVLEILAKHYDNMAEILKDTENGEVLADDEWQGTFLVLSVELNLIVSCSN